MSHYRDWYEHDEGKTYVLSRHLPPRFDISACAKFPLLRKSRLAHQVRQDVWRALQGVRGFSPVIRIDTFSDHMVLTAGGPCAHSTAHTQQVLETVLSDQAKRARWIKCATIRNHADRDV